MEIFNSAQDVRVVIRTPDAVMIDCRAIEVEVEDQLGRFVLNNRSEPALAAVVPSTIVLRKRDGSEVHIEVSWGSLTAVGNQVRVVARRAQVRYVEPLRIAV